MKKVQLLQQIVSEGVVAVLRGDSPEEVIRMAEQAVAGGIRVIEVTMTVPYALRAIEELARRYDGGAEGEDGTARPKVLVGVGSVLDPETARAAMLAGAVFVVAPAINPQTVAMCNRYGIPVMPGVMTIGEIQTALELGVDIVKLFPGQLYGPSMIRAVKGPLPQANMMPTGGVTLANIGEWVKAGAVAVGIGSDLTAEAVRTGDYSSVSEKAAQYVEAFRAARKALE